MKKLLGTLGTIAIASSGIVGIVGNTPTKKEQISKNNIENNFLQTNNLKINKQELSTNDYLEFNNKYIEKINFISNFKKITFDKNDNAYYINNNDIYILKQGETTPTKINGINKNGLNNDISFEKIILDKDNNVYFNTFENGVYLIKSGETTATKIEKTNIYDYWQTNPISIDNQNNIYIGINDGIYILKKNKEKIHFKTNNFVRLISVDKSNNVYFSTRSETFLLKSGETTATKIEGIFGNTFVNEIKFDENKIYLATYSGAYILKSGETTAIKIEGIEVKWPNSVNNIEIDNKHNVYFAGEKKDLWILKQGETTATKITQLPNYIKSIIIDNENDNIYFGSDNNEIYIMKINDLKSIRKIFNNFTFINKSKNNIYFNKNNNIYVLKQKKTNNIKIKNNNR